MLLELDGGGADEHHPCGLIERIFLAATRTIMLHVNTLIINNKTRTFGLHDGANKSQSNKQHFRREKRTRTAKLLIVGEETNPHLLLKRIGPNQFRLSGHISHLLLRLQLSRSRGIGKTMKTIRIGTTIILANAEPTLAKHKARTSFPYTYKRNFSHNNLTAKITLFYDITKFLTKKEPKIAIKSGESIFFSRNVWWNEKKLVTLQSF